MLRTAIQHTQRLNTLNSFRFSGGGHNLHNLNPHEKVEVSKYNPEGIRQLRGLQGMKNKAVKFLAKIVSDPKVTLASDCIYLPKTSQNSIPVYQSLETGGTLRDVVRVISAVLPTVFIVSGSLWGTLVMSGLYLYIYQKTYYRLINGFILKLEIIPETEEIAYQKVGILGKVKTFRAPISDLEYQNLIYQDNIFDRSTRSYINKYVSFKLKSTGEELLFDRNGIWHQQGLKHELLN